MAMEFYETQGGHQFYYGTMPKIANALERIAKALEQNPSEIDEKVSSISSLYASNKEDLAKIRAEIDEYGITNDGISDITETFEQGFNNAIEQVCKILGFDLEEVTKR